MIITQQSSLSKKKTYLRALADGALDAVKEVLDQTANQIIEDAISNYESAIPGETYVRTGTLGDSWERDPKVGAKDTGNQLTITITNAAAEGPQHKSKRIGHVYSDFVQGDKRTERHKDAEWQTIFEIQQYYAVRQGNRVRAALRRVR